MVFGIYQDSASHRTGLITLFSNSIRDLLIRAGVFLYTRTSECCKRLGGPRIPCSCLCSMSLIVIVLEPKFRESVMLLISSPSIVMTASNLRFICKCFVFFLLNFRQANADTSTLMACYPDVGMRITSAQSRFSQWLDLRVSLISSLITVFIVRFIPRM